VGGRAATCFAHVGIPAMSVLFMWCGY
jgi:hypothetical protein